jgi:hypothetical protein
VLVAWLLFLVLSAQVCFEGKADLDAPELRQLLQEYIFTPITSKERLELFFLYSSVAMHDAQCAFNLSSEPDMVGRQGQLRHADQCSVLRLHSSS